MEWLLKRRALFCQSQWPSGLRRGFAVAVLLGLLLRMPPGPWMSVSFECWVLSVVRWRSLRRVDLSSREESCRLWRVTVCDLETSRMRRLWPAFGFWAREKEREKYSHMKLRQGLKKSLFLKCLITLHRDVTCGDACLRLRSCREHRTAVFSSVTLKNRVSALSETDKECFITADRATVCNNRQDWCFTTRGRANIAAESSRLQP